jgi:2'-5' RNA ligase
MSSRRRFPRRGSVRKTEGMGQRRVAVVWFVPEPARTEINGLRRAAGDTQLRRVDPHVTLVPPVNVDEWELPDGLVALQHSVAQLAAPTICLGPVASFDDTSLVTFLEVDGAPDEAVVNGELAVEGELDKLLTLRSACFVAPFDRIDLRPFRPHATVAIRQPRHRVDALIVALSDASYRQLLVDTIHVVEFVDTPAGPRWVPLAAVAVGLAGPTRRSGWVVDTIVAAPPGVSPRFHPFTVTAYVAGELAGQLAAQLTDTSVTVESCVVAPGFDSVGVDDEMIRAAHRYGIHRRDADGDM